MKITLVAGARPNFIKIAPIIKAIEKKKNEGEKLSYRLVHTGQHYDKNLSDTFFEELNIPHPNANLEVKSGSQSVQTAAIMIAFEQELIQNPCDLVLVVGDVNSTMAPEFGGSMMMSGSQVSNQNDMRNQSMTGPHRDMTQIASMGADGQNQ